MLYHRLAATYIDGLTRDASGEIRSDIADKPGDLIGF